jgi:hypothetical protein
VNTRARFQHFTKTGHPQVVAMDLQVQPDMSSSLNSGSEEEVEFPTLTSDVSFSNLNSCRLR